MIVEHITPDIDVIRRGETDISSLNPVELLEHTELENRLYYFERMERKKVRLLKHKRFNLSRLLMNII